MRQTDSRSAGSDQQVETRISRRQIKKERKVAQKISVKIKAQEEKALKIKKLFRSSSETSESRFQEEK